MITNQRPVGHVVVSYYVLLHVTKFLCTTKMPNRRNTVGKRNKVIKIRAPYDLVKGLSNRYKNGI